jgi:branched-chain amino acid transport system permease protein
MNTVNKSQIRTLWIIAAAVIIFLAAFPSFGPDVYYLSFGILIFMYIALSSSWNIIGGYTGYASFGHAVFFGMGAYIVAILLIKFGMSPFITCFLAGIISAVLALIIGYPVLRLKGPYFSIATMCLTVIVSAVVLNLPDDLTGGPLGLYLPILDVEVFASRTIFYELMLVLAVGITLLSRAIQKSRYGLGLIAIRENEVTAETIGIDSTKLKLSAFVLSAFLVAVIGGLYAYHRNYIYPETVFDPNLSIIIVIMVMIGGAGSWQGPVIGAIILTLIDQLLVTLVPNIPPEIPRLIFGTLIILVMIYMPSGILYTLYMRLSKQKNKTAQLSSKGT